MPDWNIAVVEVGAVHDRKTAWSLNTLWNGNNRINVKQSVWHSLICGWMEDSSIHAEVIFSFQAVFVQEGERHKSRLFSLLYLYVPHSSTLFALELPLAQLGLLGCIIKQTHTDPSFLNPQAFTHEDNMNGKWIFAAVSDFALFGGLACYTC